MMNSTVQASDVKVGNPTPSGDIQIGELLAFSGDVSVMLDQASRDRYSTDIRGQLERPLAIVRPHTVEAMQEVVRRCAANRIMIAPRGGGLSYSNGYTVERTASIVMDTSALDRIVEIDVYNGIVTVEAGVTWAKLHAALKEHGVRTPFYGPFSGMTATIGGALSQNAASLGSSNFGISADNVLHMDVVTGDGEILSTGSAGLQNGHPCFRYFGPDLTGLFTGDCGALGIKARATLRLIPMHRHRSAASFNCATFEDLAKAMAAVARLGVAESVFGNDPAVLAQMTKGQDTSPAAAKAIAKAVYADAANPLIGAWLVARIGLAGQKFLKKVRYNFHAWVEGHSWFEVRKKIRMVKNAASEFAQTIPNTLPTVLCTHPFMSFPPPDVANIQRGHPQHAILPFDKVIALDRDVQALFARHESDMANHGVTAKCMYATLSTHAFLYEPIVNWSDSPSGFHDSHFPELLENVDRAQIDNPEGRRLGLQIMDEVKQIFVDHGATHFQLGKTYPYLPRLKGENQALLKTLKAALDPHGIMNPAALGL